MKNRIFKITAILISFCLLFEQTGFAQVAGQLDISSHILSLQHSFIQEKFRPVHLRSIDIRENNLRALLDKGTGKEKTENLQALTKKLLEYFFVGLTLPSDTFWVNLRPDGEDKIIDSWLERTDVGKIFLEADLQLKKDTASFTSPQCPEGRAYWDRLYKKAGELFGDENVTIPTLTRPWIVPGEVIVREAPTSAYIYKASLKVMLEQDYLKGSSVYNFKDPRLKALNEYASELVREIIVPKLTKEINTSKRYAPLRQVYYSLILAQWFKARFAGKQNVYSALINARDLTNLLSKEPWSKTTYFKGYQKSFKDGEYNLREPVQTPFGQVIRSYFSGGIKFNLPMPIAPTPNVGQTGKLSSPVKFTKPLRLVNPDTQASTIAIPTERELKGLTYVNTISISSNVFGTEITIHETGESQQQLSLPLTQSFQQKTSGLPKPAIVSPTSLGQPVSSPMRRRWFSLATIGLMALAPLVAGQAGQPDKIARLAGSASQGYIIPLYQLRDLVASGNSSIASMAKDALKNLNPDKFVEAAYRLDRHAISALKDLSFLSNPAALNAIVELALEGYPDALAAVRELTSSNDPAIREALNNVNLARVGKLAWEGYRDAVPILKNFVEMGYLEALKPIVELVRFRGDADALNAIADLAYSGHPAALDATFALALEGHPNIMPILKDLVKSGHLAALNPILKLASLLRTDALAAVRELTSSNDPAIREALNNVNLARLAEQSSQEGKDSLLGELTGLAFSGSATGWKELAAVAQHNRTAAEASRSFIDNFVYSLRSRHLDPAERLSGDKLKAELENAPFGRNPYVLYQAFTSRDNFGELAEIIFEALPKENLLPFIQGLDPEGFLVKDFLLQAANFNLMGRITTNSEELKQAMKILFTDLNREELQTHALRLAIFVERAMSDQAFSLKEELRQSFKDLYNSVQDPAQKHLLATLLVHYQEELQLFNQEETQKIAQKHNISPQDSQIDYAAFFGNGPLTVHIVFADDDAVRGHFALTRDYFAGRGYQAKEKSKTKITLENKAGDVRIVLINAVIEPYDISQNIEKFDFLISRSHQGGEKAVFNIHTPVPATGKFCLVSACRSATIIGWLDKFFPGADWAGFVDTGRGEETNLLTYYILEELRKSPQQRPATYEELVRNITQLTRRDPGFLDQFVLPGSRPLRVQRAVTDYFRLLAEAQPDTGLGAQRALQAYLNGNYAVNQAVFGIPFALLTNAQDRFIRGALPLTQPLEEVSASSPVEKELPPFADTYLQEKNGWMGSKEYLGWLGRIRAALRSKIGPREPITVYYYGIGGGRSGLAPGGVEKIDILSPLWTTDFDRLYSFDDSSPKYSAFKSAVTRELAIAGISADSIYFEELSPDRFQFRFVHNNKPRIVTITYGKDATQEYPAELNDGYTVLYSRGIPTVFRDMDAEVKKSLLEKLSADKGFIVLESLRKTPDTLGGFQRLDLGDTSWAGDVRRLDVFTKAATRSSLEGATVLSKITKAARKQLIQAQLKLSGGDLKTLAKKVGDNNQAAAEFLFQVLNSPDFSETDKNHLVVSIGATNQPAAITALGRIAQATDIEKALRIAAIYELTDLYFQEHKQIAGQWLSELVHSDNVDYTLKEMVYSDLLNKSGRGLSESFDFIEKTTDVLMPLLRQHSPADNHYSYIPIVLQQYTVVAGESKPWFDLLEEVLWIQELSGDIHEGIIKRLAESRSQLAISLLEKFIISGSIISESRSQLAISPLKKLTISENIISERKKAIELLRSPAAEGQQTAVDLLKRLINSAKLETVLRQEATVRLREAAAGSIGVNPEPARQALTDLADFLIAELMHPSDLGRDPILKALAEQNRTDVLENILLLKGEAKLDQELKELALFNFQLAASRGRRPAVDALLKVIRSEKIDKIDRLKAISRLGYAANNAVASIEAQFAVKAIEDIIDELRQIVRVEKDSQRAMLAVVETLNGAAFRGSQPVVEMVDSIIDELRQIPYSYMTMEENLSLPIVALFGNCANNGSKAAALALAEYIFSPRIGKQLRQDIYMKAMAALCYAASLGNQAAAEAVEQKIEEARQRILNPQLLELQYETSEILRVALTSKIQPAIKPAQEIITSAQVFNRPKLNLLVALTIFARERNQEAFNAIVNIFYPQGLPQKEQNKPKEELPVIKFIYEEYTDLVSMFEFLESQKLYTSQEFLVSFISTRDKSALDLLLESKNVIGIIKNPYFMEALQKTLNLAEKSYWTMKDILTYLIHGQLMLAAAPDTEEAMNDFPQKSLAILNEHAEGKISNNALSGGLKNLTSQVTIQVLNRLLEQEAGEDTAKLINESDPQMLSYLLNITGLYYRIIGKDYSDTQAKVKQALAYFLKEGDIAKLNQWLYAGAEWNKAAYDALIAAGYDPRFWKEGFSKTVPSGEGDINLAENMRKQTEQLINIADKFHIAYSPEQKEGFNSYQEADDFAKSKLLEAENIPAEEKKNIRMILEETQRVERVYSQERQKEIVTVEISKDFFKDAYSGVGVPGCFNPLTGSNKQMPLMHSLETDALFLRVYQQGKVIANAVLILAPNGVIVQPLYNASNLDLDPVVFDALAELLLKGWIPSVLMGESSAGLRSAQPYSIEQKVESAKKQILDDGWYYLDFGGVGAFSTTRTITKDRLGSLGYKTFAEIKESSQDEQAQRKRQEDRAAIKREAQQALFNLGDDFRNIEFGPVLKDLDNLLFYYTEEQFNKEIASLKLYNKKDKSVPAPEKIYRIRAEIQFLRQKYAGQEKTEVAGSPMENFRDVIIGKMKEGQSWDFGRFMKEVNDFNYANEAEIALNWENQYAFTTWVTDSKSFIEAIPTQISAIWESMQKPEKFTIVEMGAGTGHMAAKVLEQIKEDNPTFYRALSYVIVENSPMLIDQQHKTFAKNEKLKDWPEKVSFVLANAYTTMAEALKEKYPSGIEGIFISNELVDDFPVRVVRMTEQGPQELFIKHEDGSFKEEFQSINVADAPEIMAYIEDLKESGLVIPEGQEIAVNLKMLDWQRQISQLLRRGYVITIDYYEADYDKKDLKRNFVLRPGDVVWSGAKHEWGRNRIYQSVLDGKPLNITADVNLGYLGRRGEEVGLKFLHLTPQASFIDDVLDLDGDYFFGLWRKMAKYNVLIQGKDVLPLPNITSSPVKQNIDTQQLKQTADQGGLDFRNLPITTQPVLPTAKNALLPFNPNLANINLDKEWQDIQNMLRAGIIPSSERIKEYAQASCQSQDADRALVKVVSCIADILRMEEESCVPSEAALTDLLMALESSKVTSEVWDALGAIKG